MRRFMMLLKATKDFEVGAPLDEKLLSAMANWSEELMKAGARLESGKLQPTSTAVRIRYAQGKFTLTDGPFAELKELVAGFCLIHAKSLDEAIEWTKRAPFQEGEIELRPLYELFDFPVDPAEKPDGWREKEEQARTAPPARKPGTTRYMGMLKADRATEAGALPDEKGLATMGAFLEEGLQAGVFLAGEGCSPARRGRVSSSTEANARLPTDRSRKRRS